MTEILDVICIGAALVDMVAKVERHPIEDDEVFVSDLKLLSGGAAANTAYACAKLGLKTAFKHGTGSAYVALNSEGDRRIYAHSGAANYLSREDIIPDEISRAKVVFLSSLKNIDPFIKAARIAKEKEITVILNPGMLIIDQGLENIKKLLGNIDILILSQREYLTLLNLTNSELDEKLILKSSNTLLSLGIKLFVVTMGEKGAFLTNGDDSAMIPPSKVNEVTDTTGAGDAFSAGFIYKFVQQSSHDFDEFKDNVKYGNLIASKCIQKLGARNGIPTEKELKILIDEK